MLASRARRPATLVSSDSAESNPDELSPSGNVPLAMPIDPPALPPVIIEDSPSETLASIAADLPTIPDLIAAAAAQAEHHSSDEERQESDHEESTFEETTQAHDEDTSSQPIPRNTIMKTLPDPDEESNQAFRSDPPAAEPTDALDSDSIHDLFGFDIEDFVVPLSAGESSTWPSIPQVSSDLISALARMKRSLSVPIQDLVISTEPVRMILPEVKDHSNMKSWRGSTQRLF